MSIEDAKLTIRFPISLSEIEPSAFAALEDPDEPFLSYRFLSALERSACVSTSTGWTPHHFAIKDAAGSIVAFAPMYLKEHSYGEYVFDWSWADAYQRHGFDYYPKLVCSIPFTPSESRRLLVDEARADIKPCVHLFANAVLQCCGSKGFSSAHILFPNAQLDALPSSDWLRRKGVQYHWVNRHYNDFEGFLSALNSSKRKNIRKERKRLAATGISSYWVTAGDLTEQEYRAFLACYNNTYNCRGQMAYLTEDFFKLWFATMPSQCLLLFAINRDQEILASALFVRGKDTLYGRYWGAMADVPLLHFELCYYAGIEYCITNNLKRFDAGAQGEHKLLRGFEPVSTHSYHYIAHPEFKSAIDAFLSDEREHIEQYKADATRWLPYKAQ